MEHSPISPTGASVESIERILPTDLGIVPLSAVARALAGFNRDQLGSAVEVLIALMDIADGDPDAETGNDVEDDFVVSPQAVYFTGGPGCIVADEDAGAYVEWTTLHGSQKKGGCILATHEDAEDDDQDTGVEDGAFDPEEDRCPAGDDGCGPVVQHGVVRWGAPDEDASWLPLPRYGIDQSKGALPSSTY